MATTAKNYAAQAEKNLRQYAKNIEKKAPIDSAFCNEFADCISTAVHFQLPDNGVLLDDEVKGLRGIKLRLPFPAITIEWFCTKDYNTQQDLSYTPKRLIYAREVEDDILICAAAGHESGHGFESDWYPQPLIVLISKDWDAPKHACSDLTDPYDNLPKIGKTRTFKILARHGVAMPILFDHVSKQYGDEKALAMSRHDIFSDANAVLELCEALSCTNVAAETVEKINAEKNERRKKDGKLPLYETKRLVIKAQLITGKKSEPQHTDRNAPREHLRRGHIRRLPNGVNTWVQSCVVSPGSNGKIMKSYSITTP